MRQEVERRSPPLPCRCQSSAKLALSFSLSLSPPLRLQQSLVHPMIAPEGHCIVSGKRGEESHSIEHQTDAPSLWSQRSVMHT